MAKRGRHGQQAVVRASGRARGEWNYFSPGHQLGLSSRLVQVHRRARGGKTQEG
jgi:hypothetical protein